MPYTDGVDGIVNGEIQVEEGKLPIPQTKPYSKCQGARPISRKLCSSMEEEVPYAGQNAHTALETLTQFEYPYHQQEFTQGGARS